MSVETAEPATQQYLTFLIAGEEYAVRILAVREILAYGPITPVPKAPSWMRGVANVRGSVVPVVDLGMKLGIGATRTTSLTCIVIVEASIGEETVTIGLLAESVKQVIDLGPADLEPPPSIGTQIEAEYLLGIGRTGGAKFVLVLDIDAVISRNELPETSAVSERMQTGTATNLSAVV